MIHPSSSRQVDPILPSVCTRPAAARAVRSLQRIDNKDWMPPALLRLWRRKEGDRAAVAQFLIDLERLAYFLFLTRADINDRMSRYANVMDEFEPRPVTAPASQGLGLFDAEARERVQLGDEGYPLITAQNAAAAVERNKLKRGRG